MTKPTPLIILPEQAGQRIDNFLIKHLKGLPKSRLYRALRNGEVRVNKKRIKPEYRLEAEDELRIPPLRLSEKVSIEPASRLVDAVEKSIIYEDEGLLIIDKPSGMPVHGGTGIHSGVIEAIRTLRPKNKIIELVHRLDRETSGCLLIAKKRSVLVELHELFSKRQVKKQYLLLVKGRWEGGNRTVDAPLHKNTLQSGERMVTINAAGKTAKTQFRPLKITDQVSLLEAFPETGRTHQIRVHAAYMGYPIVGDDKYGDRTFNQTMRRSGIKRLCLHSAGINCRLPSTGQWIGICVPCDFTVL